MLAGITAQQFLSLAEAGLPLNLNFVTQVYKIDGATTPISEIIDQPGLVTGNGLELLVSNGQIVRVLGEALAKIISVDWTIIIEFEALDFISDIVLLHVSDDQSSVNDELVLQAFDDYPFAWEEDGVNYKEIKEFDVNYGPGVHKIGLTKTATDLDIAGNGILGNDDAGDPTVTLVGMANASLGGLEYSTIGEDVYIRSLLLLEPQTTAVLQALTEL